MMKNVATAISSHSVCFICRQRNISLHKVNQRDIRHAYVNHRIYIKSDARCCDAHLGDNGLIREEEFFIIPTKEMPIKLEMLKMLDLLENNNSPFEQFKVVRYLEDEHCIKITGWSKDEFIRFSAYIKSIYNNEHRTKEQLIALYRYWLRTGIDQKSLASMFGNNTAQCKISLYLSQIRKAIYKDFVPLFLGINHDREFFLNYNTTMTHKLHKLTKEDLVLVVDSTYCNIEKSSNNDFQYKTYSVQKTAPLFKPFIICCADGYIVDCYGPFQANANDATILQYIIETDNDLKKIMIPQKTLILLDRGFRECVDYLKERWLNPKIPTVSQYEDNNGKQLSVQQTSESRRVTKCRFIVEKKIGELKQKYALDNRRNTELGHLQVDYRIACAMANFLHKPCCADKDKAEKIGNRLKKKCDRIKCNKLDQLLPLRLDTLKVPLMPMSEINDFPKLCKTKMVERIFFGNYYMRIVKSYLADLLKNKKCAIINVEAIKSLSLNDDLTKKLTEDMKTTRIIGMLIPSRHRRSLKAPKKKKTEQEKPVDTEFKFRVYYKVFIQYIPKLNSSKSIIAYICNCQSGKKQAGCCIHVATFIYYFSYARFAEHKIRLPAEYLNAVLVDMTKKEPANQPRFVKKKRFKKAETSDCSVCGSRSCSESSDSDDNNDDNYRGSTFDPDNNQKDLDRFEECEPGNTNKPQTEENIENKKSSEDCLGKSDNGVLQSDSLDIKEFSSHIPFWGAKITFKEAENIDVTNTCTIDYFLFAFWVVYKTVPTFLYSLPELEPTETLKLIIECIDQLRWNKAREYWIVDIIKYKNNPIRNTISLFGSEYENFIKHLSKYQIHDLKQICGNHCAQTNTIISKDRDVLTFKKRNNEVKLHTFLKKNCTLCKKEITTHFQFLNDPNFLFIESGEKITIDEIPQTIQIGNREYRVLCTTLHEPNHFIGVYKINGQNYIVNDLNGATIHLPPLDSFTGRLRNSLKSYYSLYTNTSFYYLD